MRKWVRSGLSSVAGTAEPIYGRKALYSVADSITKGGAPVSRETTRNDFHWREPCSTSLETQNFYFTDLETGIIGFAQVIYSRFMSMNTSAQFTFRLFNTQDEKENIWTSTKLANFRTDGANFYADDLSIEMSEDTTTYTFKSSVTKESTIDLTVVRLLPGVIFGENGLNLYGENVKQPWGAVRHVFWPRCTVVGSIKTTKKTFKINGYSMFVMALQGMKPHHASKAWSFLNFQSDEFTAIQMEFITPRSYGNTRVNIGIVTSKDKILLTSINNEIVQSGIAVDDVGWPVPKSIEYKFLVDKMEANSHDVVYGTVSGNLDTMVERIDVMAELPVIIKNFLSTIAGTKPYVYTYANEMEIKTPEGKSKGLAFNEVVFICEQPK